MSSFNWPSIGGGTGTVTSVSLSDGSITPIYTISGSPVTTSGTLTFSLSSQTANTVFAAPNGSSGQPSFRALVAADLPSGTVLSVGIFGTSPNANGGTISAQTLTLEPADGTHPGGLSTTTQSIAGAKTFLSSVTVGSVSGNTGAVNLVGTTSGQVTIQVQGASGTYNFNLPTTSGSSGNALISGGGSASAMTWGAFIDSLQISAGNISLVGDSATPGNSMFYGTNSSGTKGWYTSLTATDSVQISTGVISLVNDSAAPGNSKYYGTNGAGTLGWYAFSAGTVQSVSFTGPGGIFAVSGSPITTSGTITESVSGTSGGVPYFSNTTTLSSSALLAQFGVLVGGGAGAAPSSIAPDSSTTKYLKSGGSSANPAWTSFTAPTYTLLTSTGTTAGWLFTITTSTTCAVGDTYTNNANTYTVLSALSAQSGQVLFMSGASAPTASGTLTRATGSGTASISFTVTTALATYTPPANTLYLEVELVGAGGGGCGGGTAGGTAAGGGSATAFGAGLLFANGGTGGTFSYKPGAGGSASLGGQSGIALTGGAGCAGGGGQSTVVNFQGGNGGSSAFGGAGNGGDPAGNAAVAGATNSGSGGGGGYSGSSGSACSGGGGGSGGYVYSVITSPTLLANPIYYCVGTAGAGGGAGTGTGAQAGAAGSAGVISITEKYH